MNDFNNHSSTDAYSYEKEILNGLKNGKYRTKSLRMDQVKFVEDNL